MLPLINMIDTKKKEKIIKKTQLHEKDTGSSAVQVELLNERIDQITKHLKKNTKDEHSRRGLLRLVSRRRTHERYLGTTKSAKK